MLELFSSTKTGPPLSPRPYLVPFRPVPPALLSKSKTEPVNLSAAIDVHFIHQTKTNPTPRLGRVPSAFAMAEQSQPTAVDQTPISPVRADNAARRNSLERHLQQRPDRGELVQKNILPASTAAPGLQAQQKELAKHMRADSLNDKIAHRPPPEELIKKGLLDEDPRSPEEKYQEAIEEEYAKREGGA